MVSLGSGPIFGTQQVAPEGAWGLKAAGFPGPEPQLTGLRHPTWKRECADSACTGLPWASAGTERDRSSPDIQGLCPGKDRCPCTMVTRVVHGESCRRRPQQDSRPRASPHLQQRLVRKGHDALKDDDVGTVERLLQRGGAVTARPPACPAVLAARARAAYPVLLAAVRGEVVDGHLDALALLQLLQSGHDEVEVEGVRVVEVVVVESGLLLLLPRQHLWGTAGASGRLWAPRMRRGRGGTGTWRPHLVEGVHGQQDHPGHVQGLDDHPGHSGLPGRAAAPQACGASTGEGRSGLADGPGRRDGTTRSSYARRPLPGPAGAAHRWRRPPWTARRARCTRAAAPPCRWCACWCAAGAAPTCTGWWCASGACGRPPGAGAACPGPRRWRCRCRCEEGHARLGRPHTLGHVEPACRPPAGPRLLPQAQGDPRAVRPTPGTAKAPPRAVSPPGHSLGYLLFCKFQPLPPCT